MKKFISTLFNVLNSIAFIKIIKESLDTKIYKQ